MKKVVFLLLLLPLFSNAQTDKKEETNKENDGILTLVHADKTVNVPAAPKEGKRKQKEDTKYYGSVQFKIGGNQITCDSATVFENESTVMAYNVTISNPGYFTTRATKFNYNKETRKGTVTENVVITALNGVVTGTSESVEVDLKTEAYRIGMGNITPPEPAK